MFSLRSTTLATALAASFSMAAPAQAAPLVYDLNTRLLAVPEVIVGSNTYSLVLRYDTDGRMTIISATPVATPTPTIECAASNFSAQIFNAISVGMSYDQVSALIGCRNDENGTVNNPGFSSPYKLRIWHNYKNGGSQSMGVIFNAAGTLVMASSDLADAGFFKSKSGF